MIAMTVRKRAAAALVACLVVFGAAPLGAQVERVDPSLVIDGDLAEPQELPPARVAAAQPPSQSFNAGFEELEPVSSVPAAQYSTADDHSAVVGSAAVPGESTATYQQDDLVGAAEGVFGQGAEGLARIIEDILAKEGEPDGYIVGREGGGAFVFGARYGSGTLYHRIEGQQPVYWRGPSLGLDAGANAANAFVLVYNLHDAEDLFETFGQGEGQAYLIGGFHVSYLRHGDVVLVPVRMGAGLRLGINVGYMKFSHKQRWFPF
jgi:hypothetical protein